MAARKKTFTAEISQELADSYYDAMRAAKVGAGLSLTDATEVTTRQRVEDEVNGITPYLTESEPEETPEA